MTFLLSVNRKEPCECARTQAAAVTPKLNPRGREALWARRKRPWSTELRGMTQVWLKVVVAESFMKLPQSLSFVEVGSSLTKKCLFCEPVSCVSSRAEWGHPEEKKCGKILVNHGLLPTRHVLAPGEGQQEDFAVQPAAQGVGPWWKSRRQAQCEYSNSSLFPR